MTYEMAVARAFLNIVDVWPKHGWLNCMKWDLMVRTYALRRLRVRAGLAP